MNLQQGSILSDDISKALGSEAHGLTNPCAVVISHDCDVANMNEQFIEVLIAERLPGASQPDGQFAGARHPRQLQLLYVDAGGNPSIVKLSHDHKLRIRKSDYGTITTLTTSESLPDIQKKALKQWLAARYGRPAFPDKFEARLRKGKDFEKAVQKIVYPLSTHIIGLFFDLGEDRFNEVEEEEPYHLSISVVYDAIDGGITAREDAEKIAANLEELLLKTHGHPARSRSIALESCKAVADIEMTLADLRRIDQWRLEYMSLKEDSGVDFIASGELPV